MTPPAASIKTKERKKMGRRIGKEEECGRKEKERKEEGEEEKGRGRCCWIFLSFSSKKEHQQGEKKDFDLEYKEFEREK